MTYITNLIIYYLVMGIMLSLIPENAYKKYISFLVGILLLVLLSKPLSFVLGISEADVNNLFEAVDIAISEFEYDADSENRYDYVGLSVREALKNDLLRQGYSVTKVDVTLNEDKTLKSCIVYADDEKNIINYISEVYNLNEDNINVVRR